MSNLSNTIGDMMAAFEQYGMRVTGLEATEATCDLLRDACGLPRLSGVTVLTFNGAAIKVRKDPLTPTQRAARALREPADKLDKEPS